MTVRRAGSGDVGALVELERLLFARDAWSAELLWCGLHDSHVCLGPHGVVGYVVVGVAGDTADLQRIGVHPSVQRTGIAHALLSAALDSAAGADRVLLEVRPDNAGALAFYAAEGFTEIGRRRRYYRDGSDALVLARPLGPLVQR